MIYFPCILFIDEESFALHEISNSINILMHAYDRTQLLFIRVKATN